MNNYRIEKLKQINTDEYQLDAFSSRNSTAVIAGPGSGKTTVLSLKAISLLSNEIINPQGIACITFSREAAREIKDRIQKLGNIPKGNSFFGTVHSFCIAEVLVRFSHLYNHFKLPDPIIIASNEDRKEAFSQALIKFHFDKDQVSDIDMNRERKTRIEGLSEVNIPSYDIARQVAIEYESILHSKGMIDFEDVVNYSTVLIQQEPFVRQCLEAKFPWLLIDEYQDLGKPLHEIVLSLLIRTNIKIFAVGDPDQSIYGFQGAFPQYLSELTSFKYQIKKVILQKNYRSNQEIIDVSELVLKDTRGYISATRLKERAIFEFCICKKDMIEQYTLVASTLIPKYQQSGIPFDEIAVLVGSNREVNELSKILSNNEIPFYVAKHNFERTDFIQWLEECAVWVLHENSASFDSLSLFWLNLIRETKMTTSFSEIELRSMLRDCLLSSKVKSSNFVNWIDYIVENLYLDDILKETPLFHDEITNFKEFKNAITKDPSRYDLKNFSTMGHPKNQVTITTRHSAKGLEFEVVILLGMEEERFPSFYDIKDREKLAESTRICFVCVSRAKRVCCLVRSINHTMNGRNGPWDKYYEPSRYWKMIENWQNDHLHE